jgi:hypothetical protein
MWWFVVLTALAASGHVSALFVYFSAWSVPPLLGGGRGKARKISSPGPATALGGPVSNLQQGQGYFPLHSIYTGFPTHRTSHPTGAEGKTAVTLSGHSLQSSAKITSNNVSSLISSSLYFFMARCWVKEAINKLTRRHIYGHSSAHYHAPNSTTLFTVRCRLWNFSARFTAFPGKKFCRKQQFKAQVQSQTEWNHIICKSITTQIRLNPYITMLTVNTHHLLQKLCISRTHCCYAFV